MPTVMEHIVEQEREITSLKNAVKTLERIIDRQQVSIKAQKQKTLITLDMLKQWAALMEGRNIMGNLSAHEFSKLNETHAIIARVESV